MRDRFLVTGGTGFLGAHLVELLLRENNEVVVLARTRDDRLCQLGADFVEGSVMDPEAMVKACKDISGIFHLAGSVVHSRTQRSQIQPMLELNHKGALAAYEVAKVLGVRIVYASTSGVVACSKSPSEVFDDSSDYCEETVKKWPYYAGKIETEKELRSLAEEDGVELICMRPALIVGPGDTRLSSTRLIRNFLTGQIPFVPPGGICTVDVRDAAQAFARAMDKGIPGHSYLLGSYSASMHDFFNLLFKVSGVKGPVVKVPAFLSVFGARLLSAFNGFFGRYDPGVDPVFAEMGTYFWNADGSAAEKVLGIRYRSVEESLRDTIDFMKAHQGVFQQQ
mmetsp:Transcript_33575/g.85953  ORF Transcript_33575/g.85953 Transcript_33575/m.85953 type:complete len:337 (-) Transcript_33575:2551-3561(-)